MTAGLAPTERLLMLLGNVRQSGPGWRADCPIGHSSRGTLSLSEADSGGVLLRCFVGCDVSAIVGALGLSMSALFPPREKLQTAADRKANRAALELAGARAGAAVIDREALVVGEVAHAILSGSPIALSDFERVVEAARRIDAVRLALAREVRT